MPNPWLNIPIEDYEGHMGPDGVRQLDALADLFARALAFAKPESVAILGAAGGNGLDRIDPAITRRVVAIDINPDYLDAVRSRYSGCGGLELHAVDLSSQKLEIPPVDLVHAALIFEHTGTGLCLENALSLVKPCGCLSVVLQLPSESAAGVSPSRYSSIESVRQDFRLIDPAEFRAAIEARGFELQEETRVPLALGKAFWMGIFISPSAVFILPETGLHGLPVLIL
jgi:hypothetical protein